VPDPPQDAKPPEAQAPAGYQWEQAFVPMPAQGWTWVLGEKSGNAPTTPGGTPTPKR